jgi:hypothetical protein
MRIRQKTAAAVCNPGRELCAEQKLPLALFLGCDYLLRLIFSEL